MCDKTKDSEVGKQERVFDHVASGNDSELAAELHRMCPEDRRAVARSLQHMQQMPRVVSLPNLEFYDDGDLKSSERVVDNGTVERRVYDDNTGKMIAKGYKDLRGAERHAFDPQTGRLMSIDRFEKDGSSIHTEFAPNMNRTLVTRNDGKGREETITFDANSGKALTMKINGRLVSDSQSSGDHVVVAYDEQGKAHHFVNRPITSLPPDYGSIPEWRKTQLGKDAKCLLDRYYKDESLSFREIAELQRDIVKRQDLTEVEKCQLFDLVQERAMDLPVKVNDCDENRHMVDSWKGSDDPWHAFAPISDKRHTELVNMTPSEASRKIFEFEDSQESSRIRWRLARHFMGRNQGDINASEAQLVAMRKLREVGTFSAYADEWERQMVGRNLCR